MPWSMASRQHVHMGETVAFEFVLQDTFGRFMHPLGLADYCAVMIEGDRLEVEANAGGRFRFSYRFDRFQEGERIDVAVSAYLVRGGRDYMKVRGQWLASTSLRNLPDRRVASDTITLTPYQTIIELSMPRPPDDLEPDTGILRIRRSDGSSTPVYIDRPHRPGFTIDGPEPDGYYHILYDPQGNEPNATGTTAIDFTIYDRAGQPHHLAGTLKTP